MCRRYQLWAAVSIAFGIGLLLGLYVDSSFLCVCIGVGAVVCGLLWMQRK